MEKYRRVVDPAKRNAIFPDESYVLRINVSGKLSNYIAYAEKTLADEALQKVELVALGRAINRAVTVAEILRRNNPGVHQLTTLRSVNITDKFIPIEEGLNELELERTSSCISIVLAKSSAEMDISAAGYAAPATISSEARISAEAIAEMDQERAHSNYRRARGAGVSNGRGGRRGGGRRGRGRARRTQEENGGNV